MSVSQQGSGRTVYRQARVWKMRRPAVAVTFAAVDRCDVPQVSEQHRRAHRRRLLGVVVRPLSDDGSRFRTGCGHFETASNSGQGEHRNRDTDSSRVPNQFDSHNDLLPWRAGNFKTTWRAQHVTNYSVGRFDNSWAMTIPDRTEAMTPGSKYEQTQDVLQLTSPIRIDELQHRLRRVRWKHDD